MTMASGTYRMFLHSGRRLMGLGPRHWWSSILSRKNGQTIWTSETYTSRAARDDTVREFIKSPAGAAFTDVYDLEHGAAVQFA